MAQQNVPDTVLTEMMDYYRARAPEYDQWWLRQGRYDHGAEENARWFAEAEMVYAALDRLNMEGHVLELAPGTGNWTERLLQTAERITAVDASLEMMAINRARVGSQRVSYMQADLFAWRPDRVYDGIFFGFWLSHVPLERLEGFFGMVASGLRRGGKVFFVDGRREQTVGAPDQPLPPADEQLMSRKLNDGRTYTVVKNFYDPAWLAALCARHKLALSVKETPTYFLYAYGTRT